MNACIDCGSTKLKATSERCKACYIKNKRNPDRYCLDCNKTLSRVNNSVRCRSCSQKGKLNHRYNTVTSPEVLEKLRIASTGKNNYMFGKTHTIEARKKISQANMGKKLSVEHIQKIIKTNTGRKHSKESIQKQRLKLLGVPRSEEVKRKLSCTRILNGVSKGEKNPMFGRRGELAPSWLGGKSFEPYTYDFNKWFKKAIRDRDGCCLLCNVGFDDLHLLKRRIHVHHIDYDKKNSFPQNCVSLCIKCHMVTNCNRDHWKTFFQSLLKDRYGYKYTQDQKIIFDFVGDADGK